MPDSVSCFVSEMMEKYYQDNGIPARPVLTEYTYQHLEGVERAIAYLRSHGGS